MERLQKVMAHAGIASRRKCEALIQQRRVTVNGVIIDELGYKVNQSDNIEVDGAPIYKEEPVYFMFYKPKSVLSSVTDDRGRTVISDYFKNIPQRIYPVGRLDYDTTGLILLTNDGAFSQLMTHPKHHIEKKYVAKVKGVPTPRQMRQLERGIMIDGRKTSKAVAKILSADKDKQTGIISLTIHEGWNHQVKKMLESVGLPVQKLKREMFGFLTLEDLRPGDYRELRSFEVQKLKNLAK